MLETPLGAASARIRACSGSPVHVTAIASAPLARQCAPAMDDAVAAGREIVVGGVLILIRTSLIAFTGALIVIRPRLIVVTRGLVAIRPRLILVALGLAAINRRAVTD